MSWAAVRGDEWAIDGDVRVDHMIDATSRMSSLYPGTRNVALHASCTRHQQSMLQ